MSQWLTQWQVGLNLNNTMIRANIVKQEWLARYSRPYLITLDQGSEFIDQDFCDMWVSDYGIKRKIISMQNPQANAIVECVHQMLGNLIQSFKLQDSPYLGMDDPWLGILAAAAFAMCSMYHTTLCMMPGQLIFGRDMILNMQQPPSWLDCNQSS